MESVRDRVARWPKPWLAAAIAGSGLLPYLVYSTFTGELNALNLALVAGMFTLVAFWYVVWPHRLIADLTLLALLAAAILSGVLRSWYPSPLSWVRLEILGHIALVHTAVFSVLCVRGLDGVKLGFVWQKRELRAGLLYAILFCVVGLPAAWFLGLIHLPAPAPNWLRIAATLAGVYCVVAFSEEFFFRGVLQNLLQRLTHPAASIAVTAALFGLAHLTYARKFPNWKMVCVAGLAGVFYGLAYRAAGSVRASMVTHAVIVTIWKALGG